MASHAAYNNKNAPVYSPTTPNLREMSPRDIPFAVQVDVTPITPQASNVQVVHPPPRHVQIPVVARAAPVASSDWEVGLFACFSTPAHCCMAFFFPCINAAAAARGIGWSGVLAGLFFFAVYTADVVFAIVSETIQDTYDDGEYYYYQYGDHSRFNSWHVASTICSLLFIASVAILRCSVRAFYHIPGSSINDWCCSFWCSCCVMSQLSAHTEKAKAKHSNTATLPAYSAV